MGRWVLRSKPSLSPQLHGTRQVHELRKPLLLVHGAADSVLHHEASEDIYRRAEEPKQIVLFADTGHSLIQAKEQLARTPRALPQMRLNPAVKDIFAFRYEDFELLDYRCHPAIPAPISV